MEFSRRCRERALSKLHVKETEASTWPMASRGFSGFFVQSLSLANLKGLGHLHMHIYGGCCRPASCLLERWPLRAGGGNSTRHS